RYRQVFEGEQINRRRKQSSGERSAGKWGVIAAGRVHMIATIAVQHGLTEERLVKRGAKKKNELARGKEGLNHIVGEYVEPGAIRNQLERRCRAARRGAAEHSDPRVRMQHIVDAEYVVWRKRRKFDDDCRRYGARGRPRAVGRRRNTIVSCA